MRSQYFYVQKSSGPTSTDGHLLTESLCAILREKATFESVPLNAITPLAGAVASVLTDILGVPVSIELITPPPEFDWRPTRLFRITDAAGTRVITLSFEQRSTDLLARYYRKVFERPAEEFSALADQDALLEVLALEVLHLLARRSEKSADLQLMCSLDVSAREELAVAILHMDVGQDRLSFVLCVTGNWDFKHIRVASPSVSNVTPELQIAFPPLKIDPELLEALQVGDLLHTTVSALNEPHQLRLLTTTGWSLGECRGVLEQPEAIRLHLDEIEPWPAEGFDPREPEIVRPTIGRLALERARTMGMAAKKAIHLPYSPEIVTLWCQARVIATGRLITHDSQLAVEITNPPA